LVVVGMVVRLVYHRWCSVGWLVLGCVCAGISRNMHDPSEPVECPLVEDWVPLETFCVDGKLARWRSGVINRDVKPCCGLQEIKDVCCLLLHLDWCFFVKLIKEGLESSYCIVGVTTIDEQQDEE